VTYHGVMAPAARIRLQAVPAEVEGGSESCLRDQGGAERADAGIGVERDEVTKPERVLP
jgi:hypothetical protein